MQWGQARGTANNMGSLDGPERGLVPFHPHVRQTVERCQLLRGTRLTKLRPEAVCHPRGRDKLVSLTWGVHYFSPK